MVEIIECPLGKIKGIKKSDHRCFLGIRYAKAPINDLRFEPPQSVDPWDGVYDATKYGPIFPQAFPETPPLNQEEDEDSLFLNIFTPNSLEINLPVVVWIHGGGFITGTGSRTVLYGGNLVSRGNLIVVTFNYRLHGLGFINLPGIIPNLGLLDQVAALEWIRENIEYFGGDPNNVTIAGNSAGGSAVCTLLGMPKAKGLFHKAICESGSGGAEKSDYKFNLTRRSSIELLSKLNIDGKNIESLKKIPIERIKRKILKLFIESGKENKEFMFGPYVDGKIVVEDSLDAAKNGNAANIPLLIGTTMDEFALFSYLDEEENPIKYFVDQEDKIFKKIGIKEDLKEKIFLKYRKFAHDLSPDKPNRYRNLISADIRFRIKSHRFADYHSKFQENTFVFTFSYENHIFGISQHASEIPIVFGNVEIGSAYGITGTTTEKNFSDTIMDAWISFIKNDIPNAEQLPKWLPYSTQKRRIMILDTNSSLKENYFSELHEVWENKI